MFQLFTSAIIYTNLSITERQLLSFLAKIEMTV